MELDEFFKNFGLKLKFIRMKKGLSQFRLAEIIDSHENNISHIECGRKNVTLKTVYKFAKALDVDPVEFFKF